MQSDDKLEVFRREFLRANTWAQRKEGVPLDLLHKLSEEELKIAEAELINSINAGDSWPILGVAHLKSTAALPKLYDLLDKSSKPIRVTAAFAIFQICRDGRMIDVVLKELPYITNQYELISILHLLPAFKDQRVTTILKDYMERDEYLVAYNAAMALGLSTDGVVRKFSKKEKGFWRKIFS